MSQQDEENEFYSDAPMQSAPPSPVPTAETLFVPALFNHCVEVWNRMREESQQSSIIDDNGDLVPIDMWEGYTTKLFRTLNLAVPQYTAVTQALQQMDCIRQVRRGGGNAKSQWAIVQAPTVEIFRARFGRQFKSKTRHAGDQAAQQLRDLAKRIDDLEKWKENHERTCSLRKSVGGSQEVSEVWEPGGGSGIKLPGTQGDEPA